MAINSLTTTRLLGLSSGMDTESIVKNLMQIEQLKLNKQLRAQTTLQWRQDALKSVNTDLTAFRNTFLTALGADAMRTSGTYISYNVAMTGSKQDAVTIKATAEAAMKKVTVNKITSLAAGASVKSSSGVSGSGKTELSEGNYIKLGDLDFENSLFTGTTQVPRQKQSTDSQGRLEFMLANGDGSPIRDSQGAIITVYKDANGDFFDAQGAAITLSQEEIDNLQKVYSGYETTPHLNSFGDATFTGADDSTVYYQEQGTGAYYQLDSDGTTKIYQGDAGFDDGNFSNLIAVSDIVTDTKATSTTTISFAINGVDFEFNRDTTLAQMLSTVNNSTAGVMMTYSRLTDGFSITSKETGANSTLTIDNKQGNAFGVNSAFGIEEYGVKDANGNAVGNAAIKGQNAVLYIEGIRVERSTNVFNIDGISYTLNNTTGTEEVDGDGKQIFHAEDAITATFTQNVDSAVEKITKFIDGYNTMINKLYSLVTEQKNSDYYALTSEEKAAMTEDQVKEWEALAKSGLLRNDRDIQNVISQMRMAFYETVEGTGLSAQDLGLRTAYGSLSGEITINEVDLRAALERDPDAVMRVFMQSSDNANEQGLTYRLENILKTYTGTTQYNTLYNLDRDMSKLVERISDMEDRMITMEERYYAKYAAMETALAKMQSQTNWISSMLGTSS